MEIAKNKKAYFDYEILESLQGGIELFGAEVKALRAHRVQLKDSFVRIIKNEAFLLHAHISYPATVHASYKPDPLRPRRLLLKRREIDKLHAKVTQKGLSIVPLSLYFNDRNLVKVKIALVKGKALYDKRATLKEKTQKREIAAALKSYNKTS